MTSEPIKIFAIGDLHLPGRNEKPMDIFGSHWENHFQRISNNWQERVTDKDIVLLPGDISWAMTLDDAMEDLQSINALPGTKVLIKGNHDYWWGSISKLRDVLSPNMIPLQNDAVRTHGHVFCGTRGWTLPSTESSQDGLKIYRRELCRLELSLQKAVSIKKDEEKITALLHYPPCTGQGAETEVTQLLEKYEVQDVVYGHLHGAAINYAFSGTLNGIRYHFVSCDGLDFNLYQL